MEGGLSQNQSLQPRETLTGYAYSYGHGTWNCRPVDYYTISKLYNQTVFSQYGRIGIERNLFEWNHFAISFPFVLSYREYGENTTADIEQHSGSNVYRYKITSNSQSQFAGLTFGPKFITTFRKWSFYTNINMNVEFMFYSIYSQTTESDQQKTSWKDKNTLAEDPYFSINLQNGFVYHLSEKFGIVLLNEIYLYNVNPYYTQKEGRKYNHLFNMNYGTNSTIINTGLRLQYSF